MALDPLELAKQLERLRLSKSQSKEKAARFIGMGERQYRRLTSDDPPTARLSTIEKVADAYGIDVGELIGQVTHTNGSLTDRLQRMEDRLAEAQDRLSSIEAAIQTGLRMLQDEVLPALPAPRPSPASRKAAKAQPKGRRARAS